MTLPATKPLTMERRSLRRAMKVSLSNSLRDLFVKKKTLKQTLDPVVKPEQLLCVFPEEILVIIFDWVSKVNPGPAELTHAGVHQLTAVSSMRYIHHLYNK